MSELGFATSEISVLDAWKQQCKRAGNLAVMELVQRATAIKLSLETHLTQLETRPINHCAGKQQLA